MLYIENSTIPSILHFIWVGGPLPQKYLRTLLKIAPVAKKSSFTLNLWLDDDKNFNKSLDNFMGFDDHNELFLNLAINAKTLGITLRNINELIPDMEKNVFYRKDKRLRSFKNFVRREAVGFKNLATVSDLLRYEILRQEGGIYCDTDTEFDIKKDSLFQPVKSLYGIKTACINDKTTSNDIVASVPQHKALKLTLENLLKEYQEIDRCDYNKELFIDNYLLKVNGLHTGWYYDLFESHIDAVVTKILGEREKRKIGGISLMDIKRSPLLNNSNTIFRCPRLDLTIHISGPAAFRVGINEFKQYEFGITKNFQLDQISIYDSTTTQTFTILGNVQLSSNSDQTWMPKQNQKLNSFDDHHIPSKAFFWKPAKQEKNAMSPFPTNLKPNL